MYGAGGGPAVTHTWNCVRGKCPHDCSYCYMRRYRLGTPRLVQAELLKTDLGENNFIFVGSSTDLFASAIQDDWIKSVLEKCQKHPKNTYLFQSKNPENMLRFTAYFPPKVIIGTTLETNRPVPKEISKAPDPAVRARYLNHFTQTRMVSIEPIMDFDLKPFSDMIKRLLPDFVSIGADSQRSGLPEPDPDKVKALILELKKITNVKLKSNLGRLLNG